MTTKESNPKDAIGSTKLQLGLIPYTFIAEVALAFTDGKGKYGAHNYVYGVRASVYLDAVKRHIERYIQGQQFDPDGTHNLANAGACLAILIDAEANGVLNDDRPPPMNPELLIKLQDDYNRRSAEIIERHKAAGRNPRHYVYADTRPIQVTYNQEAS